MMICLPVMSMWHQRPFIYPILSNADKPPIEELHQFLEFQLPRQWAPIFSDLPLGPQRRQHNTVSLQFSLMGPKLYVNTTAVKLLCLLVLHFLLSHLLRFSWKVEFFS